VYRNRLHLLLFFFPALLVCMLWTAPAKSEDLVVHYVAAKAGLHDPDTKDRNDLMPGLIVAPGDRIVVEGTGHVILTDEDLDVRVRAGDYSEVRFKGEDENKSLQFDVNTGKVNFTIVPGNKLDVKTPHMVASVRGTEFTVEVTAAATELSVAEGQVEARDNSGRSESVSTGQTTTADEQSFTDPGSLSNVMHNTEVLTKRTRAAREEAAEAAANNPGQGQGQGQGRGVGLGSDNPGRGRGLGLGREADDTSAPGRSNSNNAGGLGLGIGNTGNPGKGRGHGPGGVGNAGGSGGGNGGGSGGGNGGGRGGGQGGGRGKGR
jgi:hypothetical protein